jgi:hypothetical protein
VSDVAENASQVEEIERLRARVAELERELIDTEAWANETVGYAQAQSHWIERWGIDVNGFMRSTAGLRMRSAARIARGVYRRLGRIKNRLLLK